MSARREEEVDELLEELRKRTLKRLFGKRAVALEEAYHGFNAFIVYEDGLRSFRAGAYSEYVTEMIATLQVLIKQAREALKAYRSLERELDREWEAHMG
jgi:flagellar biosynthesis/type III secretory pathway protein FliH